MLPVLAPDSPSHYSHISQVPPKKKREKHFQHILPGLPRLHTSILVSVAAHKEKFCRSSWEYLNARRLAKKMSCHFKISCAPEIQNGQNREFFRQKVEPYENSSKSYGMQTLFPNALPPTHRLKRITVDMAPSYQHTYISLSTSRNCDYATQEHLESHCVLTERLQLADSP